MNRSAQKLQRLLFFTICTLAGLILVWASAWQTQWANGMPAQTAEHSSKAGPQATLAEFYHWYLEALAKDRNPLGDDRAKMEQYVSKTLLQQIERHINSPEGLGEDYFTKAQDYLEDWQTNIVVSDVRIEGKAASAIVTLGATKKSK